VMQNGAAEYRTSSFCGDASCVEVASLPNGDVFVRDSKNRASAPHRFDSREWQEFVRGVKAGEFDFEH
jgi:Domain of unknown function (DUF397)